MKDEAKAPKPHPPLVVHIDPGDAPSELIVELLLAFDALYRSMGGSGLKFTVGPLPAVRTP